MAPGALRAKLHCRADVGGQQKRRTDHQDGQNAIRIQPDKKRQAAISIMNEFHRVLLSRYRTNTLKLTGDLGANGADAGRFRARSVNEPSTEGHGQRKSFISAKTISAPISTMPTVIITLSALSDGGFPRNAS